MKSVAFRRPLVRFLVRFLMAVNGLLLLGSILNACLLPRLASGAAARFEERTGLALVIERPSYDPFRGLRAATVTIGDGVVLQKLRLKPAGLPRPHRLVAILSSLAAPFDETSLSWLEQPWLALGELKAAGALPRSLSVGSFTLPAAALGGAGGELQGSLSMAFRRGAAELSVTMDGPLKAKLAARVDLDGRTGELSLAASSTGLKPAALPLPAPLAFSLDLRVGSAGTDSARADSARAGSAGTDGVADAAPWLLDGTLSFALDPYQGSYAFSALLDPAARESIPMPPERAYNPAQLPAGSLRFTKGELRLDGLAAGSLAVGSLIMEIRPSWTGLFPLHTSAGSRLEQPAIAGLDLMLRGQDTQALWDILPSELTGPLSDARVGGSLDLEARLSVPLHWLASATLDMAHSLDGFAVDYLPPAYARVLALGQPFTHHIADDHTGAALRLDVPAYRRPSLDWMLLHGERSERWIRSRWETWDAARASLETRAAGLMANVEPASIAEAAPVPSQPYVYIEDISPLLVDAVLTAEDGDFFFHKGMSWPNLAAAVAKNAASGGFDFGASTLSMQVIKNLFLSQDKTLSRKAQEAALVFLMEEHAATPKERILELYLNVAEFGPGIYGAERAARHYFGLPASKLDLGQALWLASILPSPKRYYRYYEQGEISDGWFERMRGILAVMVERGRVSQAQADAVSKPRFP